MANSRFYQFLYSKDAMLTRISGSFIPAADGSVASYSGKGLLSVAARPGNTPTGVYYLELQENFNQLVGFDFWVQQGTTGPIVNSGSFAIGTQYMIINAGNMTTADWILAGFYGEDFTPTAGMVFVAKTAGSGGATSKVKALASSGIANIELLPAQAMLQNNTPGEGSLFVLMCYDYAGALAFPAAGCVVTVDLYLRNSTVTY